ncbi:type II secretion system F family protein [Candidatus Gottesmanbacteria bacterium]|nr:type II secretion system F family protein [Candidatus Gottesmanbacteria bacterium]
MARFTYKVRNTQGKPQAGIVEAATLKQAAALLHDRSFFIVDLKEIKDRSLPLNIGKNTISQNDLVHFTRQLSSMVTAGLTLIEALAILRQQLTKPSIIKLINQIEDDVRGGKAFYEALEKYPNIFPPAYLALVRAGEASGKLDALLLRLADNLEKSRDFRNKIRGILIYPIIVITGISLVATIVITVVIPKLTSLYKEFDIELPLPTQILISLSLFLVKFWWLLIILAFLTVFVILRWKQTNTGQHIFAAVALKLPVFGQLVAQSTIVETTRTLAILIDGGVPILTALEIAYGATGNILFKEAFSQAAKQVEKGFPLSEPLLNNPLFPPILGQMVAVGEQTGKQADSLSKVSTYFETEAEQAIRNLTTMIEPLIMVILGLGVAFLVIAVLVPIYSLTSKF